MSTTRWLLCVGALGVAAITWRLTLARPPVEVDQEIAVAPAAPVPEPEPRTPTRTGERTEPLAAAPAPEPEPPAPSAEPEVERSALARELERMSATFLTTRPAVAELLERAGASEKSV